VQQVKVADRHPPIRHESARWRNFRLIARFFFPPANLHHSRPAGQSTSASCCRRRIATNAKAGCPFGTVGDGNRRTQIPRAKQTLASIFDGAGGLAEMSVAGSALAGRCNSVPWQAFSRRPRKRNRISSSKARPPRPPRRRGTKSPIDAGSHAASPPRLLRRSRIYVTGRAVWSKRFSDRRTVCAGRRTPPGDSRPVLPSVPHVTNEWRIRREGAKCARLASPPATPYPPPRPRPSTRARRSRAPSSDETRIRRTLPREFQQSRGQRGRPNVAVPG